MKPIALVVGAVMLATAVQLPATRVETAVAR